MTDHSLFVSLDENDTEHNGSSWLPPLSGLIELGLFFAVAFALQYALSGQIGPFETAPHPFWIPVILLTVQYGTIEGMIAASAALFFYVLLGWSPQGGGEEFYAYITRISAEPALWIISAAVFGTFRDRQIRLVAQLQQDLRRAGEQRDSIGDFCRKTQSLNKKLQRQIASQNLCSVQKAHEEIQALYEADGEDFWTVISNCVNLLIGAEKFSLYALKNHSLNVVAHHNWLQDDEWASRFSKSDPLFQAVMQKGKSLSFTRKADAKTLGNHGELAAPITVGPQGKIVGMLKIETIQNAAITSNTKDVLQFLCKEIGLALAKGRGEMFIPLQKPAKGDVLLKIKASRESVSNKQTSIDIETARKEQHCNIDNDLARQSHTDGSSVSTFSDEIQKPAERSNEQMEG